MPWQRPSSRIRELIREGARRALNAGPEWIEELDRETVSANPTIANDPVLAKVVKRVNRANLVHWAAANVRHPGAPVPANLGGEPLRMARDLVRRGLEALTLDIYRIGQYIAWRLWINIAFDLTSDPQELHELLDVSAKSVNEFIEATLAGIAAQVQLEHDELTRGNHADRLEVVGHLLEGAPISRERAETRLGYSLIRAHTAAIIWSDDFDGDHSNLDRAADAFCHAVGSSQDLTVVANAATRWVWLAEATNLDIDTIEQAVDNASDARIAIGTKASGIEGFRRSHLEALTTQRTLARLKSDQRVAFFSDVQIVALITQNTQAANEFITSTLGELESAAPELQATLLMFINEQCNASRAAKRLYTHRNTLLRRIEAAQRLLPRPLAHTSVHVAVSLEALQWRGDNIAKLPTPTSQDDEVPA